MTAPHRRNRTRPTAQDGRKLRRHKRRRKAERLFARLQNFRRLVVRYERHADNFLAFLLLACSIILLRFFEIGSYIFMQLLLFLTNGKGYFGKNAGKIDEIYALQLVVEYVTKIYRVNRNTRKEKYLSYELNIMLKNFSRMNIITHGDKNNLKEDAKVLSRFLNKPLWDATDFKEMI